MARKQRRIRYELSDVNGVNPPSDEEIKIILRAADEIIFSAGRTMLAKILKGSKDKKVLELNLQNCPSYGYYSAKTIQEITGLVDWMVINDYLEISYNGKLPMIVFSEKGWDIYKYVYADELYEEVLNANSELKSDMVIKSLKETNRQVILILLSKLAESKNIGVVRFLEEWKGSEVKKVRAAIDDAIKKIVA